ncbi:MAG: protein phosphatase 2C domain-containing protein [Deltaproteobacteria bacterium]|jgi:hypothetical protein|nr:protein phosphatase 2C domain-containing protein [Deltaproteobacteria bacterium]
MSNILKGASTIKSPDLLSDDIRSIFRKITVISKLVTIDKPHFLLKSLWEADAIIKNEDKGTINRVINPFLKEIFRHVVAIFNEIYLNIKNVDKNEYTAIEALKNDNDLKEKFNLLKGNAGLNTEAGIKTFQDVYNNFISYFSEINEVKRNQPKSESSKSIENAKQGKNIPANKPEPQDAISVGTNNTRQVGVRISTLPSKTTTVSASVEAGAQEAPQSVVAGTAEAPKSGGAGTAEAPKSGGAGEWEDAPQSGGMEVWAEPPQSTEAGAVESPQGVEAGAAESPQGAEAGAPESPQSVEAGAAESPQSVEAGTAEAPQSVEAGTAEAPQSVEAGAAESPQSVEAVAAESPQSVEAVAAESPQSVDAVAAEAPQSAEAGAAEAPQSAEAGAADAPQSVEAGAAEAPQSVEAGTAEALQSVLEEEIELSSDRPEIGIKIGFEPGYSNFEDAINTTIKIVKQKALEYGKYCEDYSDKIIIVVKECTNLEYCRANEFFTNNIGLNVSVDHDGINIKGRPPEGFDDDIYLKLRFLYSINGKEMKYRDETIAKALFIAPDPKTMWKDKEVEESEYDGYFYPNDDKIACEIEGINKILIAASCRGRSHAHVGKPRDDNFYQICNDDTGWNVMAVADGAGSAKYSRKGSDIACKTSIELFLQLVKQENFTNYINNDDLKEWKKFYEENIDSYNTEEVNESEHRKKIEPLDNAIINIFSEVFKNIENEVKRKSDESNNKDLTIHDYNTTLLFIAFKKFDFGYFFISFWIGDGALVLYNWDKQQKFLLLGIPDAGEFAGQTRFLTMASEMEPDKIKKRIFYTFADDFESIIMMSDGVADPYFPSDNSLISYKDWSHFWNTVLKSGDGENKGCPEIFDQNVPLATKAQKLREWLDFWSVGNHDDRTLLIVKDRIDL